MENKNEILKELKENYKIPLHLKMVELTEVLVYGNKRQADKIIRVKSKKLQTDNYFIQPFRKHISQF